MDVGDTQKKLSQWAAQDRTHRFYDLYHLLHHADWLRTAQAHVRQNAGSKTAGCDGVNMRVFEEDLGGNLQRLSEALKAERFEPQPVRRTYIQERTAGGRVKRRPLGIPAIRDRIVQEALRMVLEPIWEADFGRHAYGFRPNRSTQDAVAYIGSRLASSKGYGWVIEGDIQSFFDTINHHHLIKVLAKRLRDRKILQLIWKLLRSGVMEKRTFRDTALGTPQGGIISPLLANVYLHELDKYMERYTDLPCQEKRRRRRQGLANYTYVRYADDFVVLCNGTRAQAEALKEELYSFLKESLALSLSKEKTRITHLNDGFKFLGFWIYRDAGSQGMVTKVTIPKEAMDRVQDKIELALAPGTQTDSVIAKILAMNRLIGGWCRYYQYTGKASSQFSKLAHTLCRCMAHW